MSDSRCRESLWQNSTSIYDKNPISKVKRQPSGWEKIMANEATDKQLIPIYFLCSLKGPGLLSLMIKQKLKCKQNLDNSLDWDGKRIAFDILVLIWSCDLISLNDHFNSILLKHDF